MRAIVNVSKGSYYVKYNGLTFDVDELQSSRITLSIKGIDVDFSFNEVIIVDLQKELQTAFDNFNWGSDVKTYRRLIDYCNINMIEVVPPTYNCPA